MCWTDYLRVNALIETVRRELEIVLREKLVGLFVFGSFATWNFEPSTSDVDLIAALASDLSPNDFARVSSVHEDALRRFPTWKNRLEVAYIPIGKMRRIRAEDQIALMSPGEPFHFKEAGNDW